MTSPHPSLSHLCSLLYKHRKALHLEDFFAFRDKLFEQGRLAKEFATLTERLQAERDKEGRKIMFQKVYRQIKEGLEKTEEKVKLMNIQNLNNIRQRKPAEDSDYVFQSMLPESPKKASPNIEAFKHISITVDEGVLEKPSIHSFHLLADSLTARPSDNPHRLKKDRQRTVDLLKESTIG